MATISKPVGMTAKAVNLPADVVTVQKLLNGVPVSEGGPAVPLVVDGIAGKKTNHAIQHFQLHHFGWSIADGRVDPGERTLQKLNELSAENVSVTGVTSVRATRIPPLGNPDILHFVTPRAAGSVLLRATITPAHDLARNAVVWEGATPTGPGSLEATVSRVIPGKNVVKLKRADGTVIQEMRVWVLWCTITGSTSGVSPQPGATNFEVGVPWSFIHRINPSSIVTDADRPALDGPKTSNVPGHAKTHLVNGNPLGGGATLMWDASRQIRAKVLDPQGNITGVVTEQLTYPADDAEGNDDTHPGDEDNNPYDNFHGNVAVPFIGQVTLDFRDHLRSNDRPRLRVPHALGSDGDTIELRFHFREFTRIELAGTWHRVSDFFLWRTHLKFRRTGGKWQNNGSSTAADNAGF